MFPHEPAHDGIVVRSRTDGLFERCVIMQVRDEGLEGNELLKLTEGWPSSRVMTTITAHASRYLLCDA